MFKLNKFYYPAEGEGIAADVSNEEALELLDNDDEKEEPIDIKEPKKEVSEEDSEEAKEEVEEEKDELDELEEEIKEPKEEDLEELITPVSRREILAKYPKLFKEFPHLEKAYYRERAFTEIIPTIEDAKEAVTKANILDQFDADLRDGKLENALKAVKGSGEKAFNNLVDDYLPNLARVDKDAYLHVVGNIIKTTTISMIEEAKNSSNDDLRVAAEILNEFIFRTKQITKPSNLSKQVDDKTNDAENKLKTERETYLRQRYTDSKEELDTKVTNVLKSTIEANIDPRQSMTDYVRKNAIRECQDKLDELLEGDKRLGVLIDRLWGASAKENFSKSSLDKIKSAYLIRAKQLLPTVLKGARNEALKGMGKRVRSEGNEEEGQKKGPLPAGKTASQNSGERKTSQEKAKAIPSGISNLDYLMRDDK